jgi:hypothetical protein
MIIHGGLAAGGSSIGDLWSLDCTTNLWTLLTPAGDAPSARARHSAVYDPARDQMILFGGLTGSGVTSDVHVLDLATTTWTKLTIGGPIPSARQAAGMVLRAGHDQLLVFGGRGTGNQELNDLWIFNLAAQSWTELTPPPPRPPARFDHVVAYAESLDQLVVFGGFGASGPLNDSYVLRLDVQPVAWDLLVPAGSAPSPRSTLAAPPVLVDDVLHVYGGDGSSGAFFNTSYALRIDPLQWEAVPDSGNVPAKRMAQQAVHDRTHDRMVVFGGWTGAPNSAMGDSWQLSYGPIGAPALTWSPLITTPQFTEGRYGSGHLYDPDSTRMLMFYGGTNAESYDTEIVQLDLNTLAWSEFTTVNPGPAGRTGCAVAYDSLRHRVILFGGLIDRPGQGNDSVNDTWILDMHTRTWTQVATDTSLARPGTRFRPASDIDKLRDRWIITCGADTVSVANRDTVRFWNDTWAFDLSTLTWAELPATNPPFDRYDTTGYVIEDQDRFVFFGGAVETQMDADEFWSLNLATNEWTLETPIGPTPHERNGYSMIWDSARRWLIPYAGTDGVSLLSDGAVLYQAPVPGGVVGVPEVDGATRRTRVAPGGALRLEMSRHRARGGIDFTLHVDGGGATSIRILAPDGRAVWSTSVNVPAAGASAARWDGRSATGRELANGVYFVTAAAGGSRVRERIVLLR